MMRKLVLFGLCGALIAGFILLTQAQMSDKAQLGRELFHDPTFKGTLKPGNRSGYATGLSCANCHADFDEIANPDGLIRAGHSVVGVPHRGEAKGGMIKGADFARAAGGGGFCYEHFLQRVPHDKVNPTAIPAEYAEALMAYFEVISGDNKGPEFEIAMLDADAKKAAGEKIGAMSGDSSKGWELFGRACIVCHPAANKAGVGPQLVRSRAPRDIDKTMVRWATKIRGGGSLMPFYAADILSDQEIADILAFLRQEIESIKQ
ncbi:cytochrome c [Candidatus Poribacteria bacterium]|nr:cytochrome c [Candidatus Poribacteria bacterium]MYA58885.1 cytochrome c [Candidatus Poribacteria bacterium]